MMMKMKIRTICYYYLLTDSNGLEDLRSLVGGQRTDAHLRHHLQHSIRDGLPHPPQAFVRGARMLQPVAGWIDACISQSGNTAMGLSRLVNGKTAMP